MPDPVLTARPRVALVCGGADAASHLRDAVAGHLEIVYETSAAEFDAARLADSGATAALVNLDGCEWLDAIEAQLAETGIAVVFNDPAISRNLKGFERARWLRHLTAKLSGSTDYDPPRPRVVEHAGSLASAGSGDVPSEAAVAGRQSVPATFAAAATASVETLARAPEPVVLAPGFAAASTNDAARPVLDMPAPVAVDIPDAPSAPVLVDADSDSSVGLDLDTEALSAMIDARLAETDAAPAPESTEVWRVAEVGAAPTAAPIASGTSTGGRNGAAGATPCTAAVDEEDVLKGLPSVEDWQLVDPDAPIDESTRAQPDDQPAIVISADFAGLELVPVEIATPVERHVEPVERWMQVGGLDQGRRSRREKPAPATDKDRA